MKGKVRSLRLSEELWAKIKFCAESLGKNTNSFCSFILSNACAEILDKGECDGEQQFGN